MKKQKNDTTIKLEDLGVNPNEPGMPLIDMDNMPVLALRGSPVFSGMLIPVGLARESSLQLVDEAEKNNEVIALVAQRDSEVEAPGKRDLYPVGVLGTIMDKVQLPDGNVLGSHQDRSPRATQIPTLPLPLSARPTRAARRAPAR